MHVLRIFAASASDMANERVKVEAVASMLKPLADNLGVVLEVIDWRSVVPHAGRPEQVILDQLKPDEWGVFIGMIWHRFGTPSGGTDPDTNEQYRAGTEEEFKTAYRLWKEHGRPRIMLYRCTRPAPLDALDPDQLKRVKDFFAQFEPGKSDYQVLYQTFDTTEAFERLLLHNLQRLLIDYGAEIKGQPIEPQVIEEFAPKVPDNLPRRASFFGRDNDMKKVLDALSPEDRTWGVLVDGIGGIGKTALATEAAHRCKEQALFDAFIFITAKQNILDPQGIRELTPPARTLDEFLNETARVLGRADIPQLSGDARRRALLEALREKRALLIYDNLETLSKDEQEQVAVFLRQLPPACKAIITSRRRGGEGAVWLRLEKLELEAALQLIAEEAKKDEGLKRKLERAGEARWHELHGETNGSPLALVHVLGLMRVRLSLTFNGALEMLRGNSNPDLQKFIFQEARRELTTNDATALRALSFFVPSATFEAWMEVSGLTRNALETTIDRLSALSLVDLLTGEDRYALHPLTRNFVRDELLSDAQTERTTGMRFADYWVSYAQRYGGGESNYKTFNLIEAEWLNLDAAAHWLWRTAKVQGEEIGDKDAARMLGTLADTLCGANGPLFYVGRWEEILQLSGRAYEAIRALDNWGKAGWFAYMSAWIHHNRADIDEAAKWADCCAEAWARGGSKSEQASGIFMCGDVAQQRNDYETAESLFQAALVIWRDLKSDREIAIVLSRLGGLEYEREHYDIAEGYYRKAMELHEKLVSKAGMVICYDNLGSIACARKQWVAAREWFEKGLPLTRELKRQDLIASTQFGLARVYEGEGRPDLALPLAQEALAIAERLHHRDLPETQEMVERLKKKMGEQ